MNFIPDSFIIIKYVYLFFCIVFISKKSTIICIQLCNIVGELISNFMILVFDIWFLIFYNLQLFNTIVKISIILQEKKKILFNHERLKNDEKLFKNNEYL